MFHKVMENVQMLKWNLNKKTGCWKVVVPLRNRPLFPCGFFMKAMKQANEAKAICMECPVVTECLEYAIRTNQDSGIWGGTTEDERKSIRRQYRKTGLVITG